jgi:hypothetical protein
MKSTLSRIAIVSGLVLGAFTLSALAGTWTAPTAPAPGGNPDAPINVGAITQSKLGWLGVKGLVATDLTLATGTPAAGMVLTAIDSLGNAKWQTPSGGGEGGGNWETGEINLPCQAYAWSTSQNVTFTKTFSTAPKVFTQPKWERYTGNESAAWWVTNVTTTGFTMNYATPNSGSCYPSSGGNGVMWVAVGQGSGGGGGGGGSYVKAWVSWSRTSGILASQGIASVTLDGASRPVVTLTSPMSSVNYGVVCNATVSPGAEEQIFAYNKTTSSFSLQAAHAAGEDAINLMDCSVYDTASVVAGGSSGRSVLKFNARYTTLMSDSAFFSWVGQSAWPTSGGNDHGWYVRTSVSLPRFTDTANKLCSYFMTNGVATLYSGQYSTNDYGSDNNNTAHYWDSASGTWKTEAHSDNGSIDLNTILCVGDGVLDRGLKFIAL